PQDGTTHHADLSVALASELLNTYQVPRDIQEATIHAIVAHSFSRNIEPLSLEARVVRDADRLDGLGATGIIRWAITGTLRRNSHSQRPDTRQLGRHMHPAARQTPHFALQTTHCIQVPFAASCFSRHRPQPSRSSSTEPSSFILEISPGSLASAPAFSPRRMS